MILNQLQNLKTVAAFVSLSLLVFSGSGCVKKVLVPVDLYASDTCSDIFLDHKYTDLKGGSFTTVSVEKGVHDISWVTLGKGIAMPSKHRLVFRVGARRDGSISLLGVAPWAHCEPGIVKVKVESSPLR